MSSIEKSIILGTAKLHYVWNQNNFEDIILEALKLGIETFDVAPLYGGGTTQKRLLKVLAKKNVTINTKTGLNRIKLIFENSLFEYWMRYLFFKVFKGNFKTEKDLNLFSDCIKYSINLFKNILKIDTMFIHEPPILENDYNNSLINSMLQIINDYKNKKFFKNIGIAGENVFLYKKFFNLGIIDVVQTSSSNLLKTKDTDIISCLGNCDKLNLYGIHYVNRDSLLRKLSNLFDSLERVPKVSIIVSSTKPRYLSYRIKEAFEIIPE